MAKTKKGSSSTSLSKKLRQTKRSKSTKDNDDDDAHNDAPSNVLYIGHLPPQFEDDELNEFLRQFGKVLKVRVSRSKKTGRSRGYGFAQMVTPAIAAIVADTMSGYIMFGQQRLVCHVLPNSKVHRKLFFQYKKKDKRNMPHLRQHKPLEKMKAITVRLVERERKKREKLLAMGIDFDFPGYEAAASSVDVTKEKLASETKAKNGDMEKPSKRKNSTTSMDSTASNMEQQRKEKETKRKSIDSENDQVKKRKELSASTVATNAKSPGQNEKELNKRDRGDKAKKQRKDSTASVEGTIEKSSSSAVKDKSKAKSKPMETQNDKDATLVKKKRKDSIASLGSAKSSSSVGDSKAKTESKKKTKNSSLADRKGNESIAHTAIETPPSQKRKDSVASAASAHSDGSKKKSKLDVTMPNVPPKAKSQPHSETKTKKVKKSSSSTRRKSV